MEKESVGRFFGLILFFIGLGMVIGMLISDSVIIIVAGSICLLLGYYLFCR